MHEIAEDVTPDTILKCHVSHNRGADIIYDQPTGQSLQTTIINQSTKQIPWLRVSEPTYISECWEARSTFPTIVKQPLSCQLHPILG